MKSYPAATQSRIFSWDFPFSLIELDVWVFGSTLRQTMDFPGRIRKMATDRQRGHRYTRLKDVTETDDVVIPEEEERSASFLQRHRWLLVVIGATSMLAVSNTTVKFIKYMTATDLCFVRYSGMFVYNMPFFVYNGGKGAFDKRYVPGLLCRGLFGCFSFYLSFVALKLMPIAESAVIVSTTPIWVSVLSWILIKERVGLVNGISTGLCFVGLVLMSKVFLLTSHESSRWDLNYWYGCAASLSSAILAAVTFVLVRSLKGIHETVTLAYQSSIGIVVLFVIEAAMYDVNLPKCGVDGVLVVLMSALSFGGQKLLTLALRHEKASTVSNLRFSSRVVILVVLQITVFHEIPDLYSSLAVVCVSASFLILAFEGTLKQMWSQRASRRNDDQNVT